MVRSLIQLLEQDPSQKSGILDLFLHAKRRVGARLEAKSSFFGEGEEAAVAEIHWFAVTALTRGIDCAKASQWKCAAEYLACSSAWFPALPAEKQKGLGHLSMLLSTAALLSKGTSFEQDKAAQKEMEQMLAKCEAVSTKNHPLLGALTSHSSCAEMRDHDDSSTLWKTVRDVELRTNCVVAWCYHCLEGSETTGCTGWFREVWVLCLGFTLCRPWGRAKLATCPCCGCWRLSSSAGAPMSRVSRKS